MRQSLYNSQMTIHPLFVHFPIALLSVYSLFEVFRLKRLTAKDSWFYIKAVLVILGAVSAIVTLQTGEFDAESTRSYRGNPIFQAHKSAASVTTGIFLAIAACYVILWIVREGWHEKFFAKLMISEGSPIRKLFNLVYKIAEVLVGSPLAILFALAGFALLSLTGALGGLLVYGPEADPLTKILYDIVMLFTG